MFGLSCDEMQVTTQGADYKISAHQLYMEYNANEVAADQKYKGEILEVDGIVIGIGEDLMGNLYVVLGGADIREIGAQCYFSDSHAKAVAQLKKGQTITVKGKCAGYFLLCVDLKGCKIV